MYVCGYCMCIHTYYQLTHIDMEEIIRPKHLLLCVHSHLFNHLSPIAVSLQADKEEIVYRQKIEEARKLRKQKIEEEQNYSDEESGGSNSGSRTNTPKLTAPISVSVLFVMDRYPPRVCTFVYKYVRIYVHMSFVCVYIRTYVHTYGIFMYAFIICTYSEYSLIRRNWFGRNFGRLY